MGWYLLPFRDNNGIIYHMYHETQTNCCPQDKPTNNKNKNKQTQRQTKTDRKTLHAYITFVIFHFFQEKYLTDCLSEG